MFNEQAEQATHIRVATRLSPEALRALMKALPGPACPSTDLEAGYLLGVQAVLNKLRTGFVVGDVA